MYAHLGEIPSYTQFLFNLIKYILLILDFILQSSACVFASFRFYCSSVSDVLCHSHWQQLLSFFRFLSIFLFYLFVSILPYLLVVYLFHNDDFLLPFYHLFWSISYRSDENGIEKVLLFISRISVLVLFIFFFLLHQIWNPKNLLLPGVEHYKTNR